MARFVFGAVLACVSVLCCAQGVSPVPAGQKVDGMSAVDLAAEWWKWAMAAPQEINPVADRSGRHCAVGQQGKVWFLAGGFGSSKVSRECRVPADRHLFFPVVNMVYYRHPQNPNYTCEQAKRLAALNNDTAIDLFASLDGVGIPGIEKQRVKTEKCFDVFERVPKSAGAPNAFPSATDGYWLLLQPLPKGRHTLTFGGKYNRESPDFGRMVQDIEYRLTVE